RLVERYNKPVASVAVFVDENRAWRPQRYRRELWGCATEFSFPIVKLVDFDVRSDELEQSENPFDKFVLAHLKALETKRDDIKRYNGKVRIVRGLYEQNRAPDEVRRIFRVVDWVM